MLPLHLQGWKRGSVRVASDRHMRHVSRALVVLVEAREEKVSLRVGLAGGMSVEEGLAGGSSAGEAGGGGSSMIDEVDGVWPEGLGVEVI
jgi:hypothetical protein